MALCKHSTEQQQYFWCFLSSILSNVNISYWVEDMSVKLSLTTSFSPQTIDFAIVSLQQEEKQSHKKAVNTFRPSKSNI